MHSLGHDAVRRRSVPFLVGIPFSSGAVPYYVGNSYFPTKNATATNGTGVAGFYNVNPGPLAVEVREAASGTVVMRSEVVVGAGRISYAMLSPR